MVVGFTTTYAISAYHHWCFEFESQSGRGACTTLCDKVCQWLATGRWFFPGPPVSSTNKTDRHDIAGNTVESDVKHHQTTKQIQTCIYKRRVITNGQSRDTGYNGHIRQQEEDKQKTNKHHNTKN